MSAEELDQLIQETIAIIHIDIEAYEERVAIQALQDGKSTTDRALESLQRSERFSGEHEVAKAWLQTNAPNGHIFRCKHE